MNKETKTLWRRKRKFFHTSPYQLLKCVTDAWSKTNFILTKVLISKRGRKMQIMRLFNLLSWAEFGATVGPVWEETNIWHYLTILDGCQVFSGLQEYNAMVLLMHGYIIFILKSATLTTPIVSRLVPTQSYPAYRASASMLPFLFLLFTLFRFTSMPLLYALCLCW